MIGSVVGVKLLISLPISLMYLVMGVITLYYVFTEYFSQKRWIKKIQVPTDIKSTIFFGTVAGIVGGATNAMSPILMMYLFSKTDKKDEIVKSSNICYFFGKIVQLIFIDSQVISLNRQDIILTIFITIFSIIFLFFGIAIRKRIKQDLFKNLIYLVLFVFSVKVLMTSFQLLI